MAPTTTPTMPMPNPTVDTVAFVPRELIVPWDELGHVVFVGQAPSSDDFEPKARTPNTDPTTTPTPPTTSEPIARPLLPPPLEGAGGGGAVVGAPAEGAAAPGGFAAAAAPVDTGGATELGSGSRVSETVAVAPSCKLTSAVAILKPAATAFTW